MALLKLGLVANPPSFPWKQPVGQLVPVSLRPGGASAPDRLQELAGSLGGGGTQEPRALLESLSCLLSASGVCFEGNIREWLIPASASPWICSGVAFVTPLGALLRGGGTPSRPFLYA